MKKNILTLLVSFVVAAIFLSGLFSFVKKDSFIDLLQHFYWPPFFGYLLFSFLGYWLRSLRCCWLIGEDKLSLLQMYQVVMVRQVFVDLLPMKMGEFSYVLLLKKRFNIPVELGMSSMVVVFLFDCMSLFPVLLLALLVVGSGSHFYNHSLLWISCLILSLLLVAIWKLDKMVKGFVVSLEKIRHKWFQKKHHWVDGMLEKGHKISDELVYLKDRKIYLKTFGVTFLIRSFKYLAMYCLLLDLLWYQGLGIHLLNFLQMIIALASSEITTFLPIQGIGGFGTWEAAWAGAFVLMGFSYDMAVLSGLGIHLLAQITEYIIGGACLITLWAPWKKLKQRV